MRAIIDFAKDIITIHERDELCWHVAKNVVGRLGFEDCVVYTFDKESGYLVQTAAFGKKLYRDRDICNAMNIKVGEGVTGWVAQHKKLLYVPDISQFPDYIFDVMQARSELCVPLLSGDDLLGVIDCESSQLDGFDSTALDYLQIVAAMAGGKLHAIEQQQILLKRTNELSALLQELRAAEATRKKLEEELFKTQRLEALGQFSGGIAHDFNNVLAVIMGNLEHLQLSLTSSPDLEFVENAIQASISAAGRVRMLLNFAQKADLRNTEIEINSTVEETMIWLEKTIPTNIELSLDLEKTDLWISADHSAFQSTFINIVLNAIDAMPKGGRIQIVTQDCSKVKQRPCALISIKDSGEGMDKEHAERAFEPFFSTKRSNPVHQSSGLGLSMVKGFVEQSGGKVELTSAPYIGTVVTLRFPMIERVTEVLQSTIETSADRNILNTSRILLVEDEEDVRKALAMTLRSAGAIVTEADNAHKAFQILSDAESFDLVISDVMMPGTLSGEDLVLRLQHTHPKLPTILLSGYSDTASNAQTKRLSHVLKLAKPLRREELLHSCKRALSADTPSAF